MGDVCVVHLERTREVAERTAAALDADLLRYGDGAFEEAWRYDAVVAVMASGIAVRKAAPLLDGKWSDPCLVALDGAARFCVPLLGGHHGGNDLARRLAEELGAVPAVTTGTEAAGEWSVERFVEEADAELLNRDSTVATNAAVLDGDLPVQRVTGPRLVLVDPEVSVARMRGGVSVGVGSGSGVSTEAVADAVREALDEAELSAGDVELVATGSLKRGEEGIRGAAEELGAPLLFFDKEELRDFGGPSGSRAEELGWPGVAEAAALAAAGDGELLVEKRATGRVTVAVAR